MNAPQPDIGNVLRPAKPAGIRAPVKLLLAAAACAALAAGGRLWTARETAGAFAYETRPISLGVVERTISASGPVKALVTVDVGSQLSGPISEMKADFNDRVKEGDLLAVIDRGPFEAKYASAAANLAIAKADVGLRQATLAKVQHQLSQYERDAERYRSLAPSGSASRMQLEQAETQYATAKDELAMAQAQLESAKGTVAQREAELRQADIDLTRTLIRSPINGVVIDRKMQLGQTVTAEYQTPILFQIAQDLSQIQIWVQVDEADVGAIRPGAPASFTVDAYPEQSFSGSVDQIRLAAAKIGGVITYTVIIGAQNPEQRLFPEMTATARITTARHDSVLTVPNEALRFRPPAERAATRTPASAGQAVLWVQGADGTLSPRQVRLGLKGDHVTEILSGEVKEGDAVALRAKSASGGQEP